MDKKVAITTSSFAEYDKAPLSILKKAGFQIVTNPYGRKLDVKEVLQLCEDCIGIIAGTERYTKETLKGLRRLKAISRCGAGMDNIDLDSASESGIKVVNTPDSPTVAVAELTIGLILNLLRKITRMNDDAKNGRWDKMMGNLLYGKKVGIVGFGRIGQKVAELISVFDVELSYCDIQPKASFMNCKKMELAQLLGWADIITVHVNTSSPVIGQEELKFIKPGSWFINVSRGGAIDEDVLCGALKNSRLAGAAIDVFEQEPYSGPLKELPNAILTPHIGSYARESRVCMEISAVENLIRVLGREE